MSAAHPAEAARFPVSGRRWSLRWALLGALAAVAAVGLGRPLLFDGDGDSPRGADPAADQAEALAAFREDLDPLVKEGGQVVAMGLKPGVADVTNQRFAPDVLVAMASGWATELEGLRDEVDAIEAPRFLADAHWLYVQSLDGYVHTATAVKAAASAGDEVRRDELIDLAATLGSAADNLYDRAEAALEQHEARLRTNDEE